MEIKKYVVSNDPEMYEAWPDVVLTNGGKLICVFSECNHHGCRDDARIMITESTDRGRTWSKKRALTEKTVDDDFFNCARISKLNDGTLAIVCDRLTYTRDANGNRISRKAVGYLWRADAEGENWSEPEVLPFCGIVPDKLLQLKCGRLIYASHFEGEGSFGCSGNLEQYMWYSDDNGKTWSDRITIAKSPDYKLCEVSILELKNGDLAAFMRENSFMGIDCLKCISHDKGETWEGIYRMPVPGCHRPVTGYLNDGRILMTYRYENAANLPFIGCDNVFMSYFDDNAALERERGKQWVRTIPLDHDFNDVPDLGYTGWVQFPDGEIYVVNYIKDNAEKAQIRGYSFYL